MSSEFKVRIQRDVRGDTPAICEGAQSFPERLTGALGYQTQLHFRSVLADSIIVAGSASIAIWEGTCECSVVWMGALPRRCIRCNSASSFASGNP